AAPRQRRICHTAHSNRSMVTRCRIGERSVRNDRSERAKLGNVATRTVTSTRPSVWRSAVVLKVAMAISGLLVVLFLIAHMYGNLKVFAGQEAFDTYSHHLRTMGEPILPYAGALWIMRVILLVAIIIHIYCAVTLWRRSRGATAGRGGTRYVSSKARRGNQRSYASFTMRWGGVVIALFVIYHLLHLTWNVIAPGGAS